MSKLKQKRKSRAGSDPILKRIHKLRAEGHDNNCPIFEHFRCVCRLSEENY